MTRHVNHYYRTKLRQAQRRLDLQASKLNLYIKLAEARGRVLLRVERMPDKDKVAGLWQYMQELQVAEDTLWAMYADEQKKIRQVHLAIFRKQKRERQESDQALAEKAQS